MFLNPQQETLFDAQAAVDIFIPARIQSALSITDLGTAACMDRPSNIVQERTVSDIFKSSKNSGPKPQTRVPAAAANRLHRIHQRHQLLPCSIDIQYVRAIFTACSNDKHSSVHPALHLALGFA
jgi:hypothetical protein